MASLGRVRVGDSAPDFDCKAVVDGRIKEISLASYTQANHWLILILFPKAWSFICPTEVRAFSARLQEFLYSRTCAVAFASTDSEYCLRAWNSTSEMEGGLGCVHVPLISDCNHKLSGDYGVLIESEGVAERALFIIDPKGKIRSMTINDADVGRSVDEAQRVLDALVFKDEFGEGCPVDWKKGDKGIDIAAKSKVEGPIEVRNKSWVDWARPKLTRTWSGASHNSSRSLNSITNHGPMRYNSSGENLLPTDESELQQRTPPRSGVASGSLSSVGSLTRDAMARHSPHSPVFSPTSNGSISSGNGLEGQMSQAMMQQQLDNMQAALTNQKLGGEIGMAN